MLETQDTPSGSAVPEWYGLKCGLTPPSSYAEAFVFYGWDPKFLVGEKPVASWERNLCPVNLPEALLYAEAEVYVVRVHARIAMPALCAFKELHARGLWYLLNPYGGSYAFRLQKNGTRLSAHAFGAAFDFDPLANGLGTPRELSRFGTDRRGPEAVRVLEEWGFYWGGRWARPDPMHFQFGHGW